MSQVKRIVVLIVPVVIAMVGWWWFETSRTDPQAGSSVSQQAAPAAVEQDTPPVDIAQTDSTAPQPLVEDTSERPETVTQPPVEEAGTSAQAQIADTPDTSGTTPAAEQTAQPTQARLSSQAGDVAPPAEDRQVTEVERTATAPTDNAVAAPQPQSAVRVEQDASTQQAVAGQPAEDQPAPAPVDPPQAEPRSNDTSTATTAGASAAPELEVTPETAPETVAETAAEAAPETAPAPVTAPASDVETASDAPGQGDGEPSRQQLASVAPDTSTTPDAAPTPPETDTPQPDTSEGDAAQTQPEFDLVRVETDGSTVIAGRAEPGAEVTVTADGQAIGTATASNRGEFVALVDTPQTGFAQELRLESGSGADGTAQTSEDAVIVIVEAPSEDAQAPPAPVVVLSTPEAVEVVQPAVTQPAGQIVLDTISYSNDGAVVLSGRGAPGNTARIYANDIARADAQIAETSLWTAILTDLPVGDYVLRVDEVDADGTVTSRAESPFRRVEPQVARATIAQADPLEQIVVQPGNNLWTIARERYGEGTLYTQIFTANTDQIRDPDLIYPGQIFAIPAE